jgi:hypothetical protein
MRLSDRPTVQAEIDIDANAAVVWTLISDPTRIGTFSPECLGGTWDRDDQTGGLGARFTCRNRWAGREWTTTSTVTQWEPERAVSWIVGEPREPSATWRYQLHPRKGAGTRLVEFMEFGTAPSGTTARIAEVPAKEEFVIAARTAEHRRNMELTLEAIRSAAEEHYRP